MTDVAMWAVGIIIAAGLAVIGYLINNSFYQLIKRIDKISDTLDAHNKDLITVLNRNEVQSQFIDSHTDEIERIYEKIQKIELNCALNNHHKKATK